MTGQRSSMDQAGNPLTEGDLYHSGSEEEYSKADAVPRTTSSARKRVIDETLLSPEEAKKLLSRRAYNRECATRARKRTKKLVEKLQDEVKELQEDKAELRSSNNTMKERIESLEKQNHNLMLKHAVSERREQAAVLSTMHLQQHHPEPLSRHPLGMRAAGLGPGLGSGLGSGLVSGLGSDVSSCLGAGLGSGINSAALMQIRHEAYMLGAANGASEAELLSSVRGGNHAARTYDLLR